jgi:large subunit ribosomal protein L21
VERGVLKGSKQVQAVIETGGKQYLVSANDKLEIEKLEGVAGDLVTFDKVLLTIDGEKVRLGKPYVSGARVTGKILEQTKGDKIVVFKYRAKSRYRRKTGHRQKLTEVAIESIS